MLPRHLTRASDEEGLGLVEIMISIMLIGIILAGLASSLMTTLRSIRTAEKTTLATSLHQELLESTVALPWELIGIYADDADYTATVTEDDGTDYDTVTLAAESPQDPRIAPRVIDDHMHGGVPFDIVRDIYWVDTDGDGVEEAKRIRTVIDWTDPAGSGSATFYAMRLPTGLELSDEFEVLLFTSSPNVAQLNPTSRTDEAMEVIVNTSQPSQAPDVTLEDTSGNTINLGPWSSNGDGTSWTTTLAAGSGPFPAGDQMMHLSVSSADTPPETRTAALTVTFLADGETPPDDSFTIAGVSSSPTTGSVTNQKAMCPLTHTVRVSGFTPDGDGVMHDTVELQYEYWATSGKGKDTTYTKTDSARIHMNFLHMSGSDAVFHLPHPQVSSELYQGSESITLTVIATRANSTLSKSTTKELDLVSTGTGNCN